MERDLALSFNILLDNVYTLLECNGFSQYGEGGNTVFCTRTRDFLLYTGHHTGRYDLSDMFTKVASLPPDKMQIDTVSVSAGNDNALLLY
jgi:hypothetical protein